MKPNRNDPCPCGSGRKYKQCCLAAAISASESPDQLAWTRLRRVFEGYPARMHRFIDQTYGPDAIDEAWSEFTLDTSDEDDAQILFDPETPHLQLFMPWFFHCWTPDPFDTAVADPSLHEQTPTSVYLARNPSGIEPTLRRYLEACVATPISFYEVLSCTPGQGFVARDILTDTRHSVLERSASKTLAVDDILFAQIVHADGIAILEACPPFGLPPISRLEIIKLRSRIMRGLDLFATELVREYDTELREVYLAATEAILNPKLPRLQNTDGDPLLPQRLVFDIDSADKVFEALKFLAHDAAATEFQGLVERDRSGTLLRVRFDWTKAGNRLHKSWNNTVLGSIEITRNRLNCDVNSSKRAATLKRLIDAHLGPAARYRATKIESVEAALAKRPAQGSPDLQTSPDDDELQNNPEVQEHLRQFMAAHYESWASEPIPALGGKSPAQAVRSALGREKVEALLRQMERDGARRQPPLEASIVARLRERLRLPAPQR